MRKSAKKRPQIPNEPAKARLIVVALPLLSENEIQLVHGLREGLSKLVNRFEIMVLSGGYEASLRKLADMGQLAGAIGEFMSSVWLEALVERDVEVVQIGVGAKVGISTVSTNFESVGEEAAAVLLGSGVQSVGYLGPTGPPGSQQLAEAFTKACLRRGKQVVRCGNFSGSLLKGFLRTLPLPAGVLCSSDHLAHLILLAARDEGLHIPRDLAVIGVGNSRMESLQAGMGISSFELPLEEIGKKAGRVMSSLLGGESPADRQAILLPARLHQRESSMRKNSGVERALAYLGSNPALSISAGELARLGGMSRRSFETAVRAQCGVSPGELLMKEKRARAEKLLRENDRRITAIARECGYQELSVFSAAFKRWTGSSPSAFRAGVAKKGTAETGKTPAAGH